MKEKSRKLFEKVDDNPGSYFGMLVEGWGDLAYDDEVPGWKPKKRTWADERYDELMEKGKDNWGQDDWEDYLYIMNAWAESDYFNESLNEDYVTDLVAEILGRKTLSGRKSLKWLSNNGTSGEVEYKGQKFAFRKLPNGDYKVMRSSDAGWNWSETLFKDESLKEDKFVSRDKMSKKDRKELDSQKRNTWGSTNPVTRVQPNKKAYDRKRDKKVVDEALNIGYWSEDSWGSDYPPDNWEEIVSRANEMIKNKYLQTRDEEETRDYSSRLWDGYCRRARQLEKQKDKKANLDESIRDFEWDRKLWCVVNDDGSFAGSPCLSWEEARELSAYHDGSRIYEMNLDKDQIHNDEEDLSVYGIEYGYYN